MLQAARRAPRLLGDSAPLIGQFLRGQFAPTGGFVNRAGVADLYYTLFGVESLVALGEPLPLDTLTPWLQSFTPESLDFIHACCLGRLASSLHLFTSSACSPPRSYRVLPRPPTAATTRVPALTTALSTAAFLPSAPIRI